MDIEKEKSDICQDFWCIYFDCPSFHSGVACASCRHYCKCASCCLQRSDNVYSCSELAYYLVHGFPEDAL